MPRRPGGRGRGRGRGGVGGGRPSDARDLAYRPPLATAENIALVRATTGHK